MFGLSGGLLAAARPARATDRGLQVQRALWRDAPFRAVPVSRRVQRREHARGRDPSPHPRTHTLTHPRKHTHTHPRLHGVYCTLCAQTLQICTTQTLQTWTNSPSWTNHARLSHHTAPRKIRRRPPLFRARGLAAASVAAQSKPRNTEEVGPPVEQSSASGTAALTELLQAHSVEVHWHYTGTGHMCDTHCARPHRQAAVRTAGEFRVEKFCRLASVAAQRAAPSRDVRLRRRAGTQNWISPRYTA